MNQIEALVPESVPRGTFIRAMRTVASSVTVVTTDGVGGRHGATVSAFCSVSADPPSALVCLKADSRIAQLVDTNGTFCVNVLPRFRQDIADRFAGLHDGQITDRFEGIECAPARCPAPLIAGATAFHCDLRQSVAFGTHWIFIGHVVQAWEGAPEPLTYLNGGYHRVVPQPPAPEPPPAPPPWLPGRTGVLRRPRSRGLRRDT